MRGGQPWTSDRIGLLKKLWGEGKTAADIAAQLGGLSRAAVLGKIFRLRLAPGAAETQRGVAPKRKIAACCPPIVASPASPVPDDSLVRRRASPVRRKKSRPHRSKEAAAAAPGGRRGKSVLELTNNSCRWLGN